MAISSSERKLRSWLLTASLAATVCCCILGLFHVPSIRSEREALLQSGSAVQSTAVASKAATVAAAQAKLSAPKPVVASPKKLFDKIKYQMMKDLGLKSKKGDTVLQKKAAIKLADDTEKDSDFVDTENTSGDQTNFDPPRSTVYVYAGREVVPHNTEVTSYILQSGFGIGKVGYINSASDADIRAAVWDEDCAAIIFPALKDVPDFGPNAVKDLKAWVSEGVAHSGTLLFLGSPVEVHLINEVFGFDIQQDYKEGPYYKNGRYATASVWNRLPHRARELGQTHALGFRAGTLPPESRSYYDSFGDTVAACTRYDLGRVCYLAQDFDALTTLPQLLERAAGGADGEAEADGEAAPEDEAAEAEAAGGAGGAPDDAAAARAQIAAVQRATDTWLAIFQAMLLQSESDIAPE